VLSPELRELRASIKIGIPRVLNMYSLAPLFRSYLEALGVTAVWVSPIVVNVEEDAGVAGYHGYWTQDFKSVNPHFGDLVAFREMVDVLHDYEIKVILDVVVNLSNT
jgi:maltooligosyltrehalose synthase